MIINTENTTKTNCELASTSFKIQASPIAFDILSSKLYSNNILAIVRELLCNAYDSHKATNNLNTPIDVFFPTVYDYRFKIRDYGTGLSKENILELYTTFFSSTKSDTNDFTGCFGLGSKTPFSYTSSFTVTSWYNNKKYSFIATKKDGYPHIILVNEIDSTEPNGLEINIPTRDSANAFYEETTKFLKYIPEILINSNKTFPRVKCLFSYKNISIYTNNYTRSEFYIKQGQNIYATNTNKIIYSFNNSAIERFINNYKVVIEVPIGTFGITPNREQLIEDTVFETRLFDSLISANNIIEELITNDLEQLKFFKDFYVKQIAKKYFPDDECSFSSYNSYINFYFSLKINFNNRRINDERSVYSYNVSSEDTFIIIATKDLSAIEIKKIKYLIAYYDLSQVIVIFPTRSDFSTDFVREIRHLYKTLNTINELSFTNKFTVTNLNKFFKDYPKVKLPRKKITEAISQIDKKIRIIQLDSPIRCLNTTSFNYKAKSKTLEHIKSTYSKETTIILTEDIENILKIIKIFYHKITDINKNIIYEFLKTKFTNHLFINYEFIVINKSNLKHFKNYFVLNYKELIDFIKNQKWIFNIITPSDFKHVAYQYDNIFTVLTECFNKKELTQIIHKSTIFKHILSRTQILQKLVDRPYNNTLFNDEIIFLQEEFNIVPYKINYYLKSNPYIEELEYLTQKYTYKVNKKTKENVKYLTKEKKNQIFEHLKKGNKNVLFCR
jgi:Molecular chaperone, HSP90 family